VFVRIQRAHDGEGSCDGILAEPLPTMQSEASVQKLESSLVNCISGTGHEVLECYLPDMSS
jgi:hypothetical protein